jgi:DNA-binding beta-propeller fold protein YncE
MRPLLLCAAAALAAAPGLAAQQPSADRLVVLNKRAASASVVDLATGATVATIPTGVGPHEVAVSPDGRRAIVADYGEQAPGSTLTVLDLVALEPVATIDLGEYRRPHGIAFLPDGRRVVVTVEVNRAVLVVDVDARRVERAIETGEAGTHLLALSSDGRHVYTANIGSGSVSKLDLADGRLVRTVAVAPQAEAIALSPDGEELWVGSNAMHQVRIFDAGTLDSVATVPTRGEVPIRLAFTPDGRRVLVSHVQSSDVTLLDARTREPVGVIDIPGGARPIGILVHPDGRRAWVAAAGLDQVVELDLGGTRMTRTLDAGANPDGLGLVRLER